MNIIKITIIQSTSVMDKIVFHTDISEPTYPGKGQFSVMGFAARGGASLFVSINFPGIPVEMVIT